VQRLRVAPVNFCYPGLTVRTRKRVEELDLPMMSMNLKTKPGQAENKYQMFKVFMDPAVVIGNERF